MPEKADQRALSEGSEGTCVVSRLTGVGCSSELLGVPGSLMVLPTWESKQAGQ